jgi:hypothetical protein
VFYFLKLLIQILLLWFSKETLASLARALAALVEEFERALLRLVARRKEVLDRLLAEHHLAAAYNASVLVEYEVLLREAAARVGRRSVVNLSL